jgi:hypothetical protein
MLVIALVCELLVSGAEMSAGAAAVPRALLRASVLPAAQLPHAAAAAVRADRRPRDPPGCCHPFLNCCVDVDGDDAAAPASDDSP